MNDEEKKREEKERGREGGIKREREYSFTTS